MNGIHQKDPVDKASDTQGQVKRRRGKRKKWQYEELRKEVLGKGIRSSHIYHLVSASCGWPHIRRLTRMPGFPKTPGGFNNWPAFFNTGKRCRERRVWTLGELKAEVRAKGITSSIHYRDAAPLNNWPCRVTLTRMDGFPKTPEGINDWPAFLGKGSLLRKRNHWDLKALQAEVRASGIRSTTQYQKESSARHWPTLVTLALIPGFPKRADGSKDWEAFFKNGKVYKKRKQWAIEELMQDVRAKGIQSSSVYQQQAKLNGWPSVSTLARRKDFPKTKGRSGDWDTFLGRNKKL